MKHKFLELVLLMKNQEKGVPLRAVKSFLSRIPDVFTGEDFVTWLRATYEIESVDEAMHLGTLYTVCIFYTCLLTRTHPEHNNRIFIENSEK